VVVGWQSSPSLHCAANPPVLRSFPTRRSSDLQRSRVRAGRRHIDRAERHRRRQFRRRDTGRRRQAEEQWHLRRIQRGEQRERDRSEEHTSELQSRSDLVCRLLLEKKKTTTTEY